MPNPNTRLSDSVTYVHKLGLVEQDLRFFDAEGSSVVYTNYIEGYPVFIKTQGPQIQIRYSTDNITIKFNSTNLQIPVPFDGRTVKIPKTSTVIKTLQAKGIAKSDIQRMTIGFELVRDSAHDSLVDLTPTYYIKIYNHWLSLSEWQNANLAKYRTSTTSSAKGLNVTREE
ncbi:two-component system activity regulator YycH [Lactobacillus jensenii]|uniref:two-component system activity regulator YycH n=1 Tax=Lactobacillus jensenii TaxID=109790 RepID=UPI0021520093|nr:two-component system activity regulator YycH [Lactobacillus jensenii]MDK8130885.1 two-component system activity regulator YycH [Lactobacillus jensenii]